MSAREDQESQLSLLSLPREIRDQIYLELIHTSPKASAPASPVQAGPRVEKRNAHELSFFYLTGVPSQQACQNLLLSNRQISQEVRQLGPLDFHLDVMVEFFSNQGSKTRVWPTWISYPGPMDSVRELQIDIGLPRLDLVSEDRGFPHLWAFVYYPLFQLLSRFFYRGSGSVSEGPLPRKVHVGTLKVTVASRDDPRKRGYKPSRLAILPVQMAESVFGYLTRIADAGIFAGQISRIIVCDVMHEREVKSAKLPPM